MPSSGIPAPPRLAPVPVVSRVPIGLLQGIEPQKRVLLENTRRFAAGLPANNAMLWGARGMGKSSLVKAAHAACCDAAAGSLALVEIHREDITRPAGAARPAARAGAALPDLL